MFNDFDEVHLGEHESLCFGLSHAYTLCRGIGFVSIAMDSAGYAAATLRTRPGMPRLLDWEPWNVS